MHHRLPTEEQQISKGRLNELTTQFVGSRPSLSIFSAPLMEVIDMTIEVIVIGLIAMAVGMIVEKLVKTFLTALVAAWKSKK